MPASNNLIVTLNLAVSAVKKLLFIISKPPYANKRNAELFDAALVAAAFDCEVSLLFRDEGVWSLLPEQQTHTIGQRSIAKMLLGLSDYDIDKLYVCRESLQRRGLQDTFELPASPIGFAAQQQLIASQAAVIGTGP
ncbi:MAG: DsrE family protein [Pseudomonadota bacterium]|nr:DsrE family protein [Pseudomonadota bacterium]MEC8060274.1 DsrE family protein [Pseudomonadota bacterium]MEE3174678.1 DsrE family protein [Pseudomonadota bacterium]